MAVLHALTGVRVEKPWGHEEIWARLPGHYVAKKLCVSGGCRLSLQYHVRKHETMMLESGEAYLLIGETLNSLKRIEMSPGDPVPIPPGTIHRLCAVTDSVVLETSTDHLGDVVRVSDDYVR